jgi:hypothetical protein
VFITLFLHIATFNKDKLFAKSPTKLKSNTCLFLTTYSQQFPEWNFYFFWSRKSQKRE